MTATHARTGAPSGRTQAFWRSRLAIRRAGVQWQLLAVVTGIAILASTLISSLTLLVAATELGAVRGALSEETTQPAELRVLLSDPDQPIDTARSRIDEALETVLGDAASSTSTSMALTKMDWTKSTEGAFSLLYLGDLERIRDNGTLTAGAWPTEGTVTEVAVPEKGAEFLGIEIGDSLATLGTRNVPGLSMTVTGIYSVDEPVEAFWSADRLRGDGLDLDYFVPGGGGAKAPAIGPLIVAEGRFDAASIPIERYSVRHTPDFSAVTVDSLDRLAVRLSTASADVPSSVGDVAEGLDYSSGLDSTVRSVTSGMAVTRSTVVAVSLLLFVLAIAALAQAARLLTEARVGERHLMRARGSSSSQILGLAVVEAALIAGIAAVLSPVLARLVYLLVAGQPAMVAAGMPTDSGMPIIVWAVAGITAALFGIVLVAPLVRREGSFHEGEQGNARQQRFSGLQRSGVDVALIVLAAVAYWQLLSYQGSPTTDGFGVDPVLAAGPVLILLAGALISVRLVPAVAKLTERIAQRSRGAVVSLAAWEVGRRAQRATAAILLLTLALAVGTFSHAFLATWRQSQLDQAAFALGAPVRVTAADGDAAVPEAGEPVLRLDGLIAGEFDRVTAFGEPSGEEASVIGLSQNARDYLARGRLADTGGSVISSSLVEPGELEQVVALPDDTVGLSATVRITPEAPMTGVAARVTALVQDENQKQYLIYLGVVDIDGDETQVRGILADGEEHDGLSLIAYQTQVFVKNPLLDGANDQTTVRMVIKNLGALTLEEAVPLVDDPATAIDESTRPDDDPTTAIDESVTPLDDLKSLPVPVGDVSDWGVSGEGMDSEFYPRPYFSDDWQFGLNVTIPQGIGSVAASYAHTSWPLLLQLQAVITEPLAEELGAKRGDAHTAIVNGVALPIYVIRVVDTAPGASGSTSFGPLAGGPTGAEKAVILDQSALARMLFQAGLPTLPTEWWVDVAPADLDEFIATLSTDDPSLASQSAYTLGVEMQQHPVRVATQAALWLVIAGAIALATAGFAVHATGSLRSRATEFAQLRAVGLTRGRLVGIIGIESLLLCLLGALFGVGLGLVLAFLVAPLVGVSADGSTPTPSVLVQIPANDILLMIGLLGVVLAGVVLAAARAQRVAEPATALRQGEER